ncbi:mitosis inhibitor protein kinase swe1 [Savitreella phatthalungensis]
MTGHRRTASLDKAQASLPYARSRAGSLSRGTSVAASSPYAHLDQEQRPPTASVIASSVSGAVAGASGKGFPMAGISQAPASKSSPLPHSSLIHSSNASAAGTPLRNKGMTTTMKREPDLRRPHGNVGARLRDDAQASPHATRSASNAAAAAAAAAGGGPSAANTSGMAMPSNQGPLAEVSSGAFNSPSPMKRSDALLNLDATSQGSPLNLRSRRLLPHHTLRKQPSADNVLPPRHRDSPFGTPHAIPNPSIHPLAAGTPGARKLSRGPHPLSKVSSATTSTSTTTSGTHTPTEFVQPFANPVRMRRSTVSMGDELSSSARLHQQAQALQFNTPSALQSVKPLQAAFMSTGLLSKRNRPLDHLKASKPTPNTPCKRPTFATPVPASPGTPLAPSFTGNGSGAGKDDSQLEEYLFLEHEGDSSFLYASSAASDLDNLPQTPTKGFFGTNSSTPAHGQTPSHHHLSTLPLNLMSDKQRPRRPMLFGRSPAEDNYLLTSIDEMPLQASRLSISTAAAAAAAAAAASTTSSQQSHDSSRASTTAASFGFGPAPGSSRSLDLVMTSPDTPDREMSTTPGPFAETQMSASTVMLDERAAEKDAFMRRNLESRFRSVEHLGSGEFSEVFTVEDRFIGTKYAVKCSKTASWTARMRQRRSEEVAILQEIGRHEHIVELADSWEENGHLFIQTEYCDNGSLDVFLREVGRTSRLDEFRVWKVLTELALGVAYIHDRGFLHLDLKPANIFITFEGVLKIGDFGMSVAYPAPAHTEREGDREYIAPEVLSSGLYDKPVDVFSLGLITLETAANIVLPDNGLSWQKLRSGDLSDAPRLSSSDKACDTNNTHTLGPGVGVMAMSGISSSTASASSSTKDPLGSRVLGATSHLPPHRYLGTGGLDRIVKWMLSPDPADRPTAQDLLNLEEIVWCNRVRNAGAVIFEGDRGPDDDDPAATGGVPMDILGCEAIQEDDDWQMEM